MRFLASVALLCACSDKKTETAPPEEPVAVAPAPPTPEPPKPSEPARPVEPPRPAEPPKAFAVDKLAVPGATTAVEDVLSNVREVMHSTAPELTIGKITASYVRRDGTLDPSYGKLDITFTLPDGTDGVLDDPSRPTGAPIPEVKPAERLRDRCPTITLTKGTWSVFDTFCHKTKLAIASSRPCTLATIWSKAGVDGAPPDALAVIEHDLRLGSWSFRITDKLRGVNFNRRYPDACNLDVAPPPPSPTKPVKRNPTTIASVRSSRAGS